MRVSHIVPTLITSFAFVATAAAADYYVSTTGSDDNDGLSSATAFATIDKAITAAAASSDVIHVAAGAYSTTTQWGPNLIAKLVGDGATRDDVIIQSAGTYRTLRMAANSWLEKVTVVGEGAYKADKGGAIEMSGGTVTNCVIRDGTAKNGSANTEGGNLYVSGSSLVVDCVISGGHATKRGGNVYLDAGTVRNCTITGGICDNVGGNVYQYNGTLASCTIIGGTAVNDGGNVRMNGGGSMEGCIISGGTNTASSGDKKGANVYMDSSAKMSRCRLTGGVHTAYNGGSLCVYSSSARVEDCLVEGSECGGVLLGGTSYLYNCTVVNNEPYGVWAWSATQHIFNMVVFGNTKNGAVDEWDGNLPNSSTAEFVNSALSTDNGRFTQEAFSTLVLIDSTSFADYANGDYSPAPNGALVDAGVSDPRGAAASTTDIAGNPRVSGDVDIGCYEYQKPGLTVRIENAAYSQVFAPATITFTHVAENSADPSHLSFTYDFGDGSETASTTAATISHAYANPGIYTVTIAATNDCEEESAQMTYDGYVRVASSTVYVTAGNGTGTFPYDTPATGYGNLKTAVQSALDGYTLLLGEGVHTTSDQISFNKAITIRGLGVTPEAVIVRNTTETPNTYYHRTMEMNNANGRIENITIENGCVKNQYGGNLRIAAGVVSNCVIRGGLAVADGGNAAGAGVEIAGSAGTSILTHCVVSNNLVSGTSSSDAYAGGAVFFPYGSKGKMYNTLVAYNTYTPSASDKRGAAGIRFGGGNEQAVVENCTVVANTVDGEITSTSAGAFCNSWTTTIRNTVFAGNYESVADKFTSVNFDSNMNVVKCVMDDVAFNQYCTVGSADDLFEDFAHGDFVPRVGGLLYNKGNSPSVLPAVDLAGNPRVFGRAIDIGCYECQRRLGVSILFR